MYSIPLTPVSWAAAAAAAFPGRLQTRAAAATLQGPDAASRIPAPARPPLGSGPGGNQQPDGGPVRHLRLVVLGDGVVPDLPLVVSIVLLGRVHIAGVGGHLGLTDADLKEEEAKSFPLNLEENTSPTWNTTTTARISSQSFLWLT